MYILIPLLPGFEGDVGAPGGSALQAVLHWTYQSLSQGEHCLLNKLKPVSLTNSDVAKVLPPMPNRLETFPPQKFVTASRTIIEGGDAKRLR